MSDLIKTYFQRELSAHEDEALAQKLAASPELASRFAELAEREYAALGLPKPGLKPKRRRWPWLLLLLPLGAWVAGWVMTGPQAQVSAAKAEEGGLIEEAKPAPPARRLTSPVQAPEEAPGSDSTRQRPAAAPAYSLKAQAFRGGFRVELKPGLDRAGVLSVCDGKGRELRRLEAGEGGAWFWDGRDSKGLPVPSGVYQFRLMAAGKSLRQWVQIGRAQ